MRIDEFKKSSHKLEKALILTVQFKLSQQTCTYMCDSTELLKYTQSVCHYTNKVCL